MRIDGSSLLIASQIQPQRPAAPLNREATPFQPLRFPQTGKGEQVAPASPKPDLLPLGAHLDIRV